MRLLTLTFAAAAACLAQIPSSQPPVAEGETSLARPRCQLRDASVAAGVVWLVCERADVYLTIDQGKAWIRRAFPGDFKLRAIAALTPERAFIVGDGGNLWFTSDQGRNWRRIAVSTDATLTSIHFQGEHGWIGGYSGVVLHSADSGQTWTRQPTRGSESVEAIAFADPLHGIAVGWAGAILRTVDGGATWERIRSPAALWSCSSVYMRDASNAWAVGMSGQLLRTRDGGVTWTGQRLEAAGSLSSVFFDSRGQGWITSDRDIFVSTDGGDKWMPSGLNDWVFLLEIVQAGDDLWAIGPLDFLKKQGPKWEPLRSWFVQ